MSKASALANPHYRLYFLSSCFGTLALWMTRFLFGWLVWVETESVFWVGVASTSMLIPSLIITPIFGVLSDRVNLKTGIIYWQFSQTLISIITAVILSFSDVSLTLLLILTFTFGVFTSAGSPLRMTLVPKLVSSQELPNAVGLGAILFNTSRIVSPAIAAWSLTFTTANNVFWLCSLLFFAAGLINFKLPSLEPLKVKQQNSAWNDFRYGLNIAWSHPMVRTILILTLINSQVARSLMELLPAISGTFTNGTAADLATLTACAGVGSIMGGWFISMQRGHSSRLISLLCIALFFTALSIAPLLFTRSLILISFLIGLISLMMTILGTGCQILLQLSCDDNVRGRVMSLWLTVAITGPAVGAFVMGGLAEISGIPTMLGLMLILSLLSGFWLFSIRKTLR